jgi:hypothetical protein
MGIARMRISSQDQEVQRNPIDQISLLYLNVGSILGGMVAAMDMGHQCQTRADAPHLSETIFY